jgi:hypothetical protein
MKPRVKRFATFAAAISWAGFLGLLAASFAFELGARAIGYAERAPAVSRPAASP